MFNSEKVFSFSLSPYTQCDIQFYLKKEILTLTILDKDIALLT